MAGMKWKIRRNNVSTLDDYKQPSYSEYVKSILDAYNNWPFDQKERKNHTYVKTYDNCLEQFYNQERENISIFKNPADKKGKNIPSLPGLYMVGQTCFNPHTNEKFYLIKVGRGKSLSARMKQYFTTNPMMYHIDYLCFNSAQDGMYIKSEKVCGYILETISQARMQNTDEWYLVDKDNYSLLCKKGFNFFFDKLLADNRQDIVDTIKTSLA